MDAAWIPTRTKISAHNIGSGHSMRTLSALSKWRLKYPAAKAQFRVLRAVDNVKPSYNVIGLSSFYQGPLILSLSLIPSAVS